jgi:hypothetical protein
MREVSGPHAGQSHQRWAGDDFARHSKNILIAMNRQAVALITAKWEDSHGGSIQTVKARFRACELVERQACKHGLNWFSIQA